jgi:hypothetical protein
MSALPAAVSAWKLGGLFGWLPADRPVLRLAA